MRNFEILCFLMILQLIPCVVPQETPLCPQPYCVNKTCGPNGVGGSCGSCPIGQKCFGGICVCDPGCEGLFDCGPDRCGGSCGQCSKGQRCQNGQCTGVSTPCVPQCNLPDGRFKLCGSDGCGGFCGACPMGANGLLYSCSNGFCFCVPNCENKNCGSDGCGGSCGDCQSGATCQTLSDPFPQQCSFQNDCQLEIYLEIRDNKTNSLVSESCVVNITGPANFVSNGNTYQAEKYDSGLLPLDLSPGNSGQYSFSTSCGKKYFFSNETRLVEASQQIISIVINPSNQIILLEVRDQNNVLLPKAKILIQDEAGYSKKISWKAPSSSWKVPDAQKTYSFRASAKHHLSNTTSISVSPDLSIITLFLTQSHL